MTESNLVEPGRRSVGPAGMLTAAADFLFVAFFVLLGRTSHGEEGVIAGYPDAAWPFLSGVLAGWAVVLVLRGRGRRLSGSSFAVGAVVVVATVVVGMTLRRLVTGAGTPPSFLVAATIFLSIFLFGWRALDRVLRSHRENLPRAAA